MSTSESNANTSCRKRYVKKYSLRSRSTKMAGNLESKPANKRIGSKRKSESITQSDTSLELTKVKTGEHPTLSTVEKCSERNSSNGSIDSTENLVSCYCGKPWDGKYMISCDSCGTWDHGRCVGLKEKFNAIYERLPYRCARCSPEGTHRAKLRQITTECDSRKRHKSKVTDDYIGSDSTTKPRKDFLQASNRSKNDPQHFDSTTINTDQSTIPSEGHLSSANEVSPRRTSEDNISCNNNLTKSPGKSDSDCVYNSGHGCMDRTVDVDCVDEPSLPSDQEVTECKQNNLDSKASVTLIEESKCSHKPVSSRSVAARIDAYLSTRSGINQKTEVDYVTAINKTVVASTIKENDSIDSDCQSKLEGNVGSSLTNKDTTNLDNHIVPSSTSLSTPLTQDSSSEMTASEHTSIPTSISDRSSSIVVTTINENSVSLQNECALSSVTSFSDGPIIGENLAKKSRSCYEMEDNDNEDTGNIFPIRDSTCNNNDLPIERIGKPKIKGTRWSKIENNKNPLVSSDEVSPLDSSPSTNPQDGKQLNAATNGIVDDSTMNLYEESKRLPSTWDHQWSGIPGFVSSKTYRPRAFDNTPLPAKSLLPTPYDNKHLRMSMGRRTSDFAGWASTSNPINLNYRTNIQQSTMWRIRDNITNSFQSTNSRPRVCHSFSSPYQNTFVVDNKFQHRLPSYLNLVTPTSHLQSSRTSESQKIGSLPIQRAESSLQFTAARHRMCIWRGQLCFPGFSAFSSAAYLHFGQIRLFDEAFRSSSILFAGSIDHAEMCEEVKRSFSSRSEFCAIVSFEPEFSDDESLYLDVGNSLESNHESAVWNNQSGSLSLYTLLVKRQTDIGDLFGDLSLPSFFSSKSQTNSIVGVFIVDDRKCSTLAGDGERVNSITNPADTAIIVENNQSKIDPSRDPRIAKDSKAHHSGKYLCISEGERVTIARALLDSVANTKPKDETTVSNLVHRCLIQYNLQSFCELESDLCKIINNWIRTNEVDNNRSNVREQSDQSNSNESLRNDRKEADGCSSDIKDVSLICEMPQNLKQIESNDGIANQTEYTQPSDCFRDALLKCLMESDEVCTSLANSQTNSKNSSGNVLDAATTNCLSSKHSKSLEKRTRITTVEDVDMRPLKF